MSWQRLAWITACMGLVLGLVELAYWSGWPVALGVSWGGLTLATLLAEAWAPQQAPPPPRSTRQQRRELVESATRILNGSE